MIKGLPERLKELRLKNDLSQRTVARQLNVSPSIISSYETGERTPSTENLLALSYLYHCSTDYLLGKDNCAPTPNLCVDKLTPRQVRALSELIRAIGE